MSADETGTETPTPAAAGAQGAGEAQGAQQVRPQLGIRSQYVKDLSFENPSALERSAEAERSPAIAVNVQVEARRLDETAFEVTLQITANARHEEKPVFLVELSYAGLFTFIGIPQEALEVALLVECPRLIFPFARRIVADVTRDGGFPPLLLAPIDFLALYRDRQTQAQAAQAQAAQAQAAGAETAAVGAEAVTAQPEEADEPFAPEPLAAPAGGRRRLGPAFLTMVTACVARNARVGRATRCAPLLPCRPESAAQAMTLARHAG